MERITQRVGTYFQIEPKHLRSRQRARQILLPRQVGMYLARRVTRMSLEEIGHYFGGRDHSTVLYAIEKIARVSREDEALRTIVSELLIELSGPDGG